MTITVRQTTERIEKVPNSGDVPQLIVAHDGHGKAPAKATDRDEEHER